MQFLVMMRIRDPNDVAVQKLREDTRSAHLAGASRLREAGHLLVGGAIFDEGGTVAGSAAIAEFDTRADLDEWLLNDPFTQAGVWQDFVVIPFRVAPHYKLGRIDNAATTNAASTPT